MSGSQSSGKKKEREGQGSYRAGFSEDICFWTLLSLGVRIPAHSSFLRPWTSFGGSFCLGALCLWLHDLHVLAATSAWDSNTLPWWLSTSEGVWHSPKLLSF